MNKKLLITFYTDGTNDITDFAMKYYSADSRDKEHRYTFNNTISSLNDTNNRLYVQFKEMFENSAQVQSMKYAVSLYKKDTITEQYLMNTIVINKTLVYQTKEDVVIKEYDVVIKEYIESKIGSTENFNDLTRDEQDDYLRKAIYVAAGMLDAKDGKNYADTYKDYFYYMDDYKYNDAELAKVSSLYEAMSKMEAVRNEGMSENYVSSIILSGIDTGEKHKFIDNKTYLHIIETPLSKLEEEKNPENIALVSHNCFVGSIEVC